MTVPSLQGKMNIPLKAKVDLPSAMERAAAVELLDFFSMEKDNNPHVRSDSNNYDSRLPPSIDRRRCFNGIQSVISKMNPQLLKSVIASGVMTAAPVPSSTMPCAPHVDREEHPPLPLYPPFHRPSIGDSESDGETAPLTIFYNGTVMVFDVPPHKAEGILKLAVSGSGSVLINKPENPTVVPPGDHRELIGSLTGDLSMARRRSLQRFLEKRKERLTSATPYYWDDNKTK